MNRLLKISAAVAATLGLGLAVAAAVGHPGGMGSGLMQGMPHAMGGAGHGPMGGHTAMLTRQDAGSAADMDVVHELLDSNTRIRRTVTKLPDGVRTLTESDDPKVAQAIQAHVASMSQRLQEGREFNIFSKTLPVLFENRDKIVSKVESTPKGMAVTRTSTNATVVAALQGHAGEVSELARDGMAAMRRGMMTRMAMGSATMGPGAMRQGMGQGMGQGMNRESNRREVEPEHRH